MMSSGTSTDSPSFRPWHVFTVTALLGSAAAILVTEPPNVIILVLICLTVGSAGLVGLMTYRTLRPLTQKEYQETAAMAGSRTRAAVEREKTLVLRSIKELEFDRAMGKVSDRDFDEMGRRLRERALRLMKQLDVEAVDFHALIEHELGERLAASGESTTPAVSLTGLVCGTCQTENDRDASFCKGCGTSLSMGEA